MNRVLLLIACVSLTACSTPNLRQQRINYASQIADCMWSGGNWHFNKRLSREECRYPYSRTVRLAAVPPPSTRDGPYTNRP